MNRQLFFHLFFVLIIFVLIAPTEAHAYLDPGTTSYVFQLLIAGLLGSTFFFKSIIGKVKKFFKKNDSSVEGASGDED